MAKILVIGSGGREHAIVSSFANSSAVSKVYAAPGNPGMKIAQSASPYSEKIIPLLIDIHSVKDVLDIVVSKNIDLVFIGPEQLLEKGIVDYLEDNGITVIGPKKKAAALESSKIFAKKLMAKYDIPTASFRSFSDLETAEQYLTECSYPAVIKADGLAAGKGVVIAADIKEAKQTLHNIMKRKAFGEAGKKVIIEEYLQGWEASIFAISDGKDYKLTIFSQDHKKLLAGDKGQNTGGMGAYAPLDKAASYLATVDDIIFKPLFKALDEEDIEYKGFLYAGIMFTEQGPQVLEFNCRLGDPEAQVLLPLLKTDLMTISKAVSEKKVKELQLEWLDKYAVNIVAASAGYPNAYEKDKIITISDKLLQNRDVYLFTAGVSVTKPHNEPPVLHTSGGRVLSVTALGDTLDEAATRAYESIKHVYFEGIYYRRDIAYQTTNKRF